MARERENMSLNSAAAQVLACRPSERFSGPAKSRFYQPHIEQKSSQGRRYTTQTLAPPQLTSLTQLIGDS